MAVRSHNLCVSVLYVLKIKQSVVADEQIKGTLKLKIRFRSATRSLWKSLFTRHEGLSENHSLKNIYILYTSSHYFKLFIAIA